MLKFTVNKIIQGEDTFGTGTIYTFPVADLDSEQREIQGAWKHVDNQTGEVAISLN